MEAGVGKSSTYTHNGRQYVTVAADFGGILARRAVNNKVPTGDSVWTFALLLGPFEARNGAFRIEWSDTVTGFTERFTNTLRRPLE
jgi:hypothetical protein